MWRLITCENIKNKSSSFPIIPSAPNSTHPKEIAHPTWIHVSMMLVGRWRWWSPRTRWLSGAILINFTSNLLGGNCAREAGDSDDDEDSAYIEETTTYRRRSRGRAVAWEMKISVERQFMFEIPLRPSRAIWMEWDFRSCPEASLSRCPFAPERISRV